MCTVVLSVGQHSEWPLLLAANRDERLDRPWLAPSCHWPDQPDVLAGKDVLAGGTWLGINRAGVVAAVLNRTGSLGPAPGKASRGALPLRALRHATADAAAQAIAALNAEHWRSFNLIIADRDGAFFLRGTGYGKVTAHPMTPGTHIVTAHDPDDMSSPTGGEAPSAVPSGPAARSPDWESWIGLIADTTQPADSAINLLPRNGFGTVGSSLVAAGRSTVMLSAEGPPGSTPFRHLAWPAPSQRVA